MLQSLSTVDNNFPQNGSKNEAERGWDNPTKGLLWYTETSVCKQEGARLLTEVYRGSSAASVNTTATFKGIHCTTQKWIINSPYGRQQRRGIGGFLRIKSTIFWPISGRKSLPSPKGGKAPRRLRRKRQPPKVDNFVPQNGFVNLGIDLENCDERDGRRGNDKPDNVVAFS